MKPLKNAKAKTHPPGTEQQYLRTRHAGQGMLICSAAALVTLVLLGPLLAFGAWVVVVMAAGVSLLFTGLLWTTMAAPPLARRLFNVTVALWSVGFPVVLAASLTLLGLMR